jgi:hypothetical protein
MATRLSALRAGRFLSPGRFLVLIFVRRWVDPRAIVRLEGLGKIEKKKCTSSGTRTGDLSAYSIVPQPTALTRVPSLHVTCTKCLKLILNERSFPSNWRYITNILTASWSNIRKMYIFNEVQAHRTLYVCLLNMSVVIKYTCFKRLGLPIKSTNPCGMLVDKWGAAFPPYKSMS